MAVMGSFTIKALDARTLDDFVRLAAKHNGVWGGCWCMEFHAEGAERGPQRRALKMARVRDGRAHAALVYDGAACVGWCQFGSADELPRIKHRRAYDARAVHAPDWRITCFFVDKEYRGRGVASAALAGALVEIGRLGGGTVESFPEAVDDRRVSAGFLHNATVSLFERHGFTKVRPLGKHCWLMTMTVRPSRSASSRFVRKRPSSRRRSTLR